MPAFAIIIILQQPAISFPPGSLPWVFCAVSLFSRFFYYTFHTASYYRSVLLTDLQRLDLLCLRVPRVPRSRCSKMYV